MMRNRIHLLTCAALALVTACASSGMAEMEGAMGTEIGRASGDYYFLLCVMRGLETDQVPAIYRSATRDTVVIQGGALMPLSTVHPTGANYIQNKNFWQKRKPIRFQGKTYSQVSGTTSIEPHKLSRISALHGVGVFALHGSAGARPRAIFLPVRPGCVFQKYRR